MRPEFPAVFPVAPTTRPFMDGFRRVQDGPGFTPIWIAICGADVNRDLIRIAVARHHQQAKPLSGAFIGKRTSYRGIEVSVLVLEQTPVALDGSC